MTARGRDGPATDAFGLANPVPWRHLDVLVVVDPRQDRVAQGPAVHDLLDALVLGVVTLA